LPKLLSYSILILRKALTRARWGSQLYKLVFSDAFNVPNRTFFPGDDPYWEVVDLWYRPTNDTEWYDLRRITTRAGHLVVTLEQIPSNELACATICRPRHDVSLPLPSVTYEAVQVQIEGS